MIEIRNLRQDEIDHAAQLLAEAFVTDGGMTSLYPPMTDVALKSAIKGWFVATLKTWLSQNQIVLAALADQQLVGVLVGGHTQFKMNPIMQLSWAWGVWRTGGLSPVLRTMKHDEEREATFNGQKMHIVEFVAVDQNQRGAGVGRQLFDQFHQRLDENAPVWLETTRQENLSIFEKLGYQESSRTVSFDVEHIQMIKS